MKKSSKSVAPVCDKLPGQPINPNAPRDQLPSAFARILQKLVYSSPGAIGAVLADEEGETVDYFGEIETDDLKLAAAYMGILLNRVCATKTIKRNGRLHEVRLLGERMQFVSRPFGSGYHVTVVVETYATIPKLHEALDQAMAELRVEAGGVL